VKNIREQIVSFQLRSKDYSENEGILKIKLCIASAFQTNIPQMYYITIRFLMMT